MNIFYMGLFLKMFYEIFGRRKEPDQQEAAIQKLRETEEMLKEKQESLEKSIQKELLSVINEKNNTNKLPAVQALKRKRRYEKQVEQIEGKISNVESQREALENANVYTKVLKNMSFAAKAMKSVHENMDVDNVDDQIQAIAEQQEMALDISDMISKPMGPGEVYDEDELLAELEEMKRRQRLADKKMLEIDGTLPSVTPLSAESVSLSETDGTLPNLTSLPVEPVSLPETEGTPSNVSSTLPAFSTLAHVTSTTHTQQHTDNTPDEPVLKKPRLNL